ncbi:MAG: SMI1/KNR4 family protein [Deltaproteobacteria bacterium]|nr:SMI1/KNR4 family protein [Deltaproteobacteria bacterium]
MPASFGQVPAPLLAELRRRLALPERYAAFLGGADPVDVETVTPTERIRFIPAADLESEQIGYGAGSTETPAASGWRRSWIVVAHSALLGDPYFLDTERADAEGDCPVMTAMSGKGALKPVLCASSFERFVRILAATMELGAGFAAEATDEDDEAIFREAVSPKLKTIDAAALRAGHWT